MIKKSLLFFIALISMSAIAFQNSAHSDPLITEVDTPVRDGGQVRITGSAFGIKSPAPPLFYDDFDNGKVDTIVPSDGIRSQSNGWTSVQGVVTYCDQNNLPGSILCSKHDLSGKETYERAAILRFQTDANLVKLFVSMWAYYSWGVISDPPHGMKYFRLEAYANEAIHFKDVGYSDGTHYFQLMVGGSGSGSYGYGTLAPPNEAWHKFELQAKQSSQSRDDGSILVIKSQPAGPMIPVLDLPAVLTRAAPEYWDRIILGEYCTQLDHSIDCDAFNYFDKVYIDNTWARVEIGDSPQWDTCTKRETQIPVTWSNNSITITANTGSLSYGNAYLYVTDAEGNRNVAGFPIQVASSSQWLANAIDDWQSGNITREDLNRAVYWYLRGAVPSGDPMNELNEGQTGNAITLSISQ